MPKDIAMYKYREITESDNEAVAALIRDNLEQFGLDIPGTVYFDDGLDHLSDFYGSKECRYFVVEDKTGKVIGGIGFANFELMKETAELQKLYLLDSAKGSGQGYEMIRFIEDKMREAGYKQSYLETHDNLQAAIHIYEKYGYNEVFMITVNLYYKGMNGNARAFADEMESSGIADAVRAEDGNLRYEYFQPLNDPETILLIDSWSDQAAIDAHHASPMMKQLARLRDKYDLHMIVERFVSDEYESDEKYLRK